MEKFIDLHIHTCYSDGVFHPSEIVSMAVQKGLAAIAIADHDSTDGVDEALESGSKVGVEVIPAVEFSIAFKSFRDVHLLGYFIDHKDPQLETKLAEFRQRRDTRAQAIVERINARLTVENKDPITYDEILAIAKDSISRLHIAKIVVARGAAKDLQDAFRRYLGPFDVPKEYFPMEEALSEIKRLNGLSVLAHPPSISNDRKVQRSLIREWREMGLDGIEVFNNLCYKDDMIFFEGLAREHHLLMTGGSDFHGVEDDVEIGIGRGGLAVSYGLLNAMKQTVTQRAQSRV